MDHKCETIYHMKPFTTSKIANINNKNLDINEMSNLLEELKKEFENKDFYVYAVETENRFVGWISLTYIPKIGIWGGHGHIFVDELWVQPDYRGRGLAKALMKKADELKEKYNATGIRLYVNVNNPTAKGLYEKCGYVEDGQAYFMEKTK